MMIRDPSAGKVPPTAIGLITKIHQLLAGVPIQSPSSILTSDREIADQDTWIWTQRHIISAAPRSAKSMLATEATDFIRQCCLTGNCHAFGQQFIKSYRLGR